MKSTCVAAALTAALISLPAAASAENTRFTFDAIVDNLGGTYDGTPLTASFSYDTSSVPDSTNGPFQNFYGQFATVSGFLTSDVELTSAFGDYTFDSGRLEIDYYNDGTALYEFLGIAEDGMSNYGLDIFVPNQTYDPMAHPVGSFAGDDARLILNVPGTSVAAPVVSSASSPVSAAPEPGVWALMITGIGIMGAALRQRRRSGGLATA